MKKIVLGKSVEGRSIDSFSFGEGSRNFYLIGGVHGSEPEGIRLIEDFLEKSEWLKSFDFKKHDLRLCCIPKMNPDGCFLKQRKNARAVDLNRNMPTKDWDPMAHQKKYEPGESAGSELETQILLQAFEENPPSFILSAHSWIEPMINFNGPSEAHALEMAKYNQHLVKGDIGYPTPGALGTWAGWERKVPTLTLEIERDLPLNDVWKIHGLATEKVLDFAIENA